MKISRLKKSWTEFNSLCLESAFAGLNVHRRRSKSCLTRDFSSFDDVKGKSGELVNLLLGEDLSERIKEQTESDKITRHVIMRDDKKKGKQVDVAGKKPFMEKEKGCQKTFLHPVFYDRFNSQSASTSGSAVFTSYSVIFPDQTHNKYGAYLFCMFLALKTALTELSTDGLFRIMQTTWKEESERDSIQQVGSHSDCKQTLEETFSFMFSGKYHGKCLRSLTDFVCISELKHHKC